MAHQENQKVTSAPRSQTNKNVFSRLRNPINLEEEDIKVISLEW